MFLLEETQLLYQIRSMIVNRIFVKHVIASGGVAVGATADMIMTPGGAMITEQILEKNINPS